jgi:hypothetical protein
MKHLIITVGGTGQMVLHYYAQMFVLGIIPENFRAFVIDADDAIGSLAHLDWNRDGGLFSICSRAFDSTLVESHVPRISNIRIAPASAADKVHSVLGYNDFAGNRGYEHPAQALFSNYALSQTVRQGLYGNPCLSAVIGLEDALSRLDDGAIQADTRIVYRLQQLAAGKQNVSLRLVLLGSYFRSEQAAFRQQDVIFDSNKRLFHKSLEAAITRMHSYVFIEEPLMRAPRDGKAETEARNLAWPAQDEPYWRGACALHHLLAESKKAEQPKFGDKLAPLENYAGEIEWSAARARLARALERVDALIGRDVVRLVASEAAPRSVWGEGLYSFLRAYWDVVSVATRQNAAALKSLPAGIQREMGAMWAPPGGKYGISHLFPRQKTGTAAVSELRNVRWPAIPAGSLRPDYFENTEAAHRLAATALLYAALRFGGR